MGVSEMDARGIHKAFIVKLLALKYVCPSLTHPITISAPSILPWPLEMPNPTHPVVFASTVKKISFFPVSTFQYRLTFWPSSSGEKNESSSARLAEEDCTTENEFKRRTHSATDNIVLVLSQAAKNEPNRNSYLHLYYAFDTSYEFFFLCCNLSKPLKYNHNIY